MAMKIRRKGEIKPPSTWETLSWVERLVYYGGLPMILWILYMIFYG